MARPLYLLREPPSTHRRVTISASLWWPAEGELPNFGWVCCRFAPGMARPLLEISPHFMVATYAVTNSRRYALKQEIKPSDDVEDEETSLTLWHFILEFHSGGSWSLGVQDFKILYIETIDKTVKLSTTRRRRGIHLTVIPPTNHSWRHSRNNFAFQKHSW